MLLKKIFAHLGHDAVTGAAKFGSHPFRVGSAVLRTQREEIVRVVDGGLLNFRRLVVLVDDVALVIDRREVSCSSEDLLGSTGRDDNSVGDG